MNEYFEVQQGKTVGNMGLEALWFFLHTLFAVLVLVTVMFVISLTHADSDSTSPKLVGTILAFLVPMVVGFAIARAQRVRVAKYVWISGLLIFSVVCVWVLDLPTGVGLCERCGAIEKLSRTFFEINHGSGLMGGDGLLVGTWIPLSLFGYALGAKFGLGE